MFEFYLMKSLKLIDYLSIFLLKILVVIKPAIATEIVAIPDANLKQVIR